MRPGARSIRGAMGTYFWVSVAALVLLAVVLWSGGDEPRAPIVRLSARGPWIGATLDDGRLLAEVTAGGALELRPGDYCVILVRRQGEAVVFSLRLDVGDDVRLDQDVR